MLILDTKTAYNNQKKKNNKKNNEKIAYPGEWGEFDFQSYPIIRFKCPVFNYNNNKITQDI